MLDIGLQELLIILAVALIVLGPQKLPEIARKLGRGLAEFRRTSEDLRRTILLGDDPPDHPSLKDNLPAKPTKPVAETAPDRLKRKSEPESVHPTKPSPDEPSETVIPEKQYFEKDSEGQKKTSTPEGSPFSPYSPTGESEMSKEKNREEE